MKKKKKTKNKNKKNHANIENRNEFVGFGHTVCGKFNFTQVIVPFNASIYRFVIFRQIDKVRESGKLSSLKKDLTMGNVTDDFHPFGDMICLK